MMLGKPKLKAFAAGLLIATATSMLIHLHYQFLIYHQKQGERALAQFKDSGKVDGAMFGAFGYNGLITTVKEGHDSVEVVNVDTSDGTTTPVSFYLSYMSRMFVIWHPMTWLGFGIAFAITVLLALNRSVGARLVSASGWFLMMFGTAVLAGAFILKGYLGLDGLGDLGSVQSTNVFLGPAIAMFGLWLQTTIKLDFLRLQSPVLSLKYLVALFAMSGIAVSLLSWRVHNSEDGSDAIREICGAHGIWDCGTAERSQFSEFLGVPTAAFGVAGFAAFIMLLVFDGYRSRQVQFGIAFVAFIFALSLSYRFAVARYIGDPLQARWCKYCVISQALLALILLSSGLRLFLLRDEAKIAAIKTAQ